MRTDDVINEIEKVVRGKREVVTIVLATLIAGGHVLLEDIPGVGKTTLAVALSKALGLDYSRVQFTPDVVPGDLLGFTYYDQKTGEFIFREGSIYTNLFLADEINRTSPKTQSALLEVMEETGKGQFIFTSHNLRPLEVLDKKYLYFTTTNPKKRYVRLKGISATNNLRDTYFREILVSEQADELYNRTKRFKLVAALKKAGREDHE